MLSQPANSYIVCDNILYYGTQGVEYRGTNKVLKSRKKFHAGLP
jgi:hypothetical protein